MKYNKRLAFIFIAIIILLVSCMPLFYAGADAGGFAGDTDWGGDFDWGTSSDWGDSSDYDSSGGGLFLIGSSLFSSPIVIVLVIVIVIVYAIIKNKKKKATRPQQPVSIPYSGLPVSELKKADPNFSEEAFLDKVRNYYVELQNSWTKKDLEPMRPVMADVLFNQFERQLQPYIEKRETNYVDRIAVLGARIVGYQKDETNDILKVELKTRIVDYVLNDNTGTLVRGSQSKELFMTYEWTLVRSIGKQTLEQEELTKVSCPSCGAPMNINQSRKCEYCGAVVQLGEYDWVISSIRGIAQRSN